MSTNPTNCKVLYPPLRGDILALAENYETDSQSFDSCLPIQARAAMEKLTKTGHTLPKRCFITTCHPCLYDAYGMTLVESAVFQCPSIVNAGNKVGAQLHFL